ncbi:MAG TPA: tRNA pseudouridine(55) synthase TruB [Bacteroidia bacterium]|nr:tRNA pseudouridine(55) synthase TruB [Bacteroidia bacterium]
MDFENGEVLLFDKPYKWTSFDLVRKIRYVTKTKKVGHAGTLDPLATGLLIICTGKKTKIIDQIQGQEKEYTGSFFLGATTPCFDKEQPVNNTFPTDHIGKADILKAADHFCGELLQMPPPFSAIRVGGKRAYELARQGKEVPLEPRKVTITTFQITSIELPLIHFKIVCSKGTYIRSLANDFGVYLKSGAYLNELCRTRIGIYSLENATSPETFEVAVKAARNSISD